ncbi:MAG: amidohydrolase family protein, partial [Planctomycetaceae bacterium]|nr:amidohydrolase family protein [Planctomycetaceae bacterium]
NSYMLHAIETYPDAFRGVAIIDENKPDVPQTMRQLATQGVRGFRLYAFADRTASWPGSAAMKTMWTAGADQNLAMCLLTDPESLEIIDKMCTRHPQTPVVIDHFARIGMKGPVDQSQLDALLRLARFPQVKVKVSAFYALGQKKPPYLDLGPMIRQLRDAFGAERLMWGSDCPYQVQKGHDYRSSIELIRSRLDFLTPLEKQQILQTTAESLFFGPSPG